MKAATDIAEFSDGLLLDPPAPLVPAIDADLPDERRARRRANRVHARRSDYLELTKPRMNFLVVVTTLVGYYMAGGAWGDWKLLLHTLLGTALTAAGSSVLNQWMERVHDGKMPRTLDRPLPAGRINPTEALFLGVLLSVVGMAELYLFVNPLTAALGAITLGTYLFLYTPLKRLATVCTIVGAIPGAIPPMMGVTAATGAIAPAAWLLFLILFVWQMPHFLAIAILYRDDYAKGGYMMLPVVDPDLSSTGRQIVLYSMALVPVSLLPSLAMFRVAGPVYFAAAMFMSLGFLGFGVRCALTRTRADARQLFFASILYLPCLLGALMIDRVG